MSKFQPIEAAKVKQFLDNNADFMFIPSSDLVQMVEKNEHTDIKKMPDLFKDILKKNKPIRISGDLALRYYEGTLDKKNSFVLDKGDIKVITKPINIKLKEDF